MPVDYIPITEKDKQAMLEVIGVSSIDELFSDIPKELREKIRYERIPQEDLSE
ncbi:MAG: glycine dehydrogenase, partial [bacterium]|nr:glycine dehydrogenase [bacterium]